MISEGDYVLLYLDERRSWIARAETGKQFHTHKGIIDLSELVGKSFGSSILTDLGQVLYAIRPTLIHHVARMQRPTQILYEKDVGLVLVRLGIGPGSKVIEAGTGSGAMTAALANTVRPNGHVYTYEIRQDMAAVAHKNLVRTDLLQYVTMKIKDARLGFDEEEMDAVFLDLAEPWEVIPSGRRSLSSGAHLASFSPTINQVEKTVQALNTNSFIDVRTLECFVRDIKVEMGRTRPRSVMIGHTGYLTFAAKILS